MGEGARNSVPFFQVKLLHLATPCSYYVFAMPLITAILHTCNDGLRLGRALETLRPCDEILVLDHGSSDHTLRVAREYAAIVHVLGPDQSARDAILTARHSWLLVILPSESITEGLEAELFEWMLRSEDDVASIPACSVFLREETGEGWSETRPTTRLIPRNWDAWEGNFPRHDPRGPVLQGDLLRFRQP